MAKPDCDDGWVKLAHELLAALACAGFNKWEWVVIREVLNQVYGPSKRREAVLSPTDIASRVGTYKESIVRAIRSLKAGGVLRETETGVRFIKDYDTWTWDGEPRLAISERHYCRAVRPSNISTNNGNESAPVASTEGGNESVPISTNMGNESAPRRERKRSPSGTKALPVGNESAPRTHSVERAGLRILQDKREERECARTPDPDELTTGRTGDEHKLFLRAMRDLEGHKPTAFLAPQLVMAADTPGIRGLESWRLIVGVSIVQKPDRPKRWDTFLRAAQNATRDEFDRLGPTAPDGKSRPRPDVTTNQPLVIPDDEWKQYEAKAAEVMSKLPTRAEYEAQRARAR